MPRIPLALIFAAATVSAHGEEFDARFVRGQEAARSPGSANYVVPHVPRFRAVAVSCARKRFTWSDPFRIVADVTASGRLENVASDAHTPFVQCVLEGLEAISLGAPPAVPFALAIRFEP